MFEEFFMQMLTATAPIDTNLFLSDCQIVRDPMSTNLFFTASCSYNIECMLLEECPRMPLSHGMSQDDLALSAHARHQCSLTLWQFCTTFTDLVFEWASATIKFIKRVFHSAIRWCFIAKQRFKFINGLSSW